MGRVTKKKKRVAGRTDPASRHSAVMSLCLCLIAWLRPKAKLQRLRGGRVAATRPFVRLIWLISCPSLKRHHGDYRRDLTHIAVENMTPQCQNPGDAHGIMWLTLFLSRSVVSRGDWVTYLLHRVCAWGGWSCRTCLNTTGRLANKSEFSLLALPTNRCGLSQLQTRSEIRASLSKAKRRNVHTVGWGPRTWITWAKPDSWASWETFEEEQLPRLPWCTPPGTLPGRHVPGASLHLNWLVWTKESTRNLWVKTKWALLI